MQLRDSSYAFGDFYKFSRYEFKLADGLRVCISKEPIHRPKKRERIYRKEGWWRRVSTTLDVAPDDNKFVQRGEFTAKPKAIDGLKINCFIFMRIEHR